MCRYSQHFMAGLRADVEQLVTVDFHSLDPKTLLDLFDAVMILKLAQKTLPPLVWKHGAAYRNGLINYKRMNGYLESYMGTKQKAELALRRQWTIEEKKQALTEYVYAPSLVKKQTILKSRDLPSPIFGGMETLPPTHL